MCSRSPDPTRAAWIFLVKGKHFDRYRRYEENGERRVTAQNGHTAYTPRAPT